MSEGPDDELLLRALDGELTPDQRQALAQRLDQEPALRTQLREQIRAEHLLQQHAAAADDGFTAGVLHAHQAQAGGQDLAARVTRLRRHRQHQRWLLLAAALVLMACGVVLGDHLLRAPSAPWVVADQVPLRITGAQSGRADSDRPLRIGDRLEVVDGARPATLQGVDGSWLVLAPGSSAELMPGGLRLHAGSVDASTARQPTDAAFRIEAAGAELRVLGTRYRVQLHGERAELLVDSGRVAVTHGNGTRRVLSADQVLTWTAQELGPVQHLVSSEVVFSHDWSRGLPEDQASGTFDATTSASRPLPYKLDQHGVQLMTLGSRMYWQPTLGRFHPDDHMVLEARFAGRGFLVLMLCLRDSDDRVVNIFHTVSELPQGSDWSRLAIPLRRFSPSDDVPGPQTGDHYLLYVLHPTEASGMELRSLGIERRERRTEQ